MSQTTSKTTRWTILGLGNPGSKYRSTRHNAGVWALELLSEELGIELKLKASSECLIGEGVYDGTGVVLCFPQTFMNESGRVISPLRKRFGEIDPKTLIVMHDELDLSVGTVRVKDGGGLAGHNGLKSISAHLGTNDYLRIRIGIGHPGDRAKVLNWVLSSPTAAEATELNIGSVVAKDAALSIMKLGVDQSMGVFNGRPA